MTDATPKRIQRKRTKGAKLPANTICVDRSTRFGNPFEVASFRQSWLVICNNRLVNEFRAKSDATKHVISRFKCEVVPLLDLTSLRGKNLACWCRLCPDHAAGKPFTVECDACELCHSDALGRAANP